MVVHLPPPERPLHGGRWWRWDGRRPWFRVYHAAPGRGPTNRRRFGPLERFDPHTPPANAPAICPAGRSVIYLGDSLRTAAAELFGAHRMALVCPRYRAAAIGPIRTLVVQNLRGAGAMMIGALPAINVADLPRAETQAWARAIHEDRPGRPDVCGVRYDSAYAGGVALALWDSAPPLEVVRLKRRHHDVALSEPEPFARLLAALVPLRIEVRLVESAECPRCSPR